jgi:hypothetical protein
VNTALDFEWTVTFNPREAGVPCVTGMFWEACVEHPYPRDSHQVSVRAARRVLAAIPAVACAATR